MWQEYYVYTNTPPPPPHNIVDIDIVFSKFVVRYNIGFILEAWQKTWKIFNDPSRFFQVIMRKWCGLNITNGAYFHTYIPPPPTHPGGNGGIGVMFTWLEGSHWVWNIWTKYTVITRLLGRPQPQMYPPVALNQYTWVNRTNKHYLYMLQGPMKILK